MQKRTIRPDPVIPDHEVLRKIGGGAYGEVWLAQGVTGALRAAKVVYREDFSDERTFEREFEGILKFEPISRDHPGLVHILHVGRSEGEEQFYYYVMELGDDAHTPGEVNPVEYEPRTVRTDALNSPGIPLDTNFCIETGRRLAEALSHLHERNLTHRDVKPSNIIFLEGKAKLADIGLVAALDQRTFVGTEGFVPPEGPGSVGADVYSLGKVLYEMATGMDRLQFPELPMDGPTEEDRKKWIRLNRIICDVCEPRLAKRKIQTADALVAALSAIEQGKKVKQEIDPGLKIMGLLMLVLAFLIFPTWFQQSWGTKVIEGAREPLPMTYTNVVLISQPAEALVRAEDGEVLGSTKINLGALEVGSEQVVTLEKKGYQDQVVPIDVEDKQGAVQVVNVKLLRDSPPVIGQLWEDALGVIYLPEGDTHVSSEYVGVREWAEFRSDVNEDFDARVVVDSAYGEKVEIVAVSELLAEQYVKWLERRCRRNGYLRELSEEKREENREIRLLFANDYQKSQLPEPILKSEARPFRCEVRVIPYAGFRIESEPEGAQVYIGGVPVGQTPWEGAVPPGVVTYLVELEGYESKEGEVTLADKDNDPLVVELKVQADAVRFERRWSNSLGMEFVPMGKDLMVSQWETRVKDFEAFRKDVAKALEDGEVVAEEPKVEVIRPKFDQTPDHPVVNVTREDAIAFCEWLTEREQQDGTDWIQERHLYRLPTDLEWSEMAGLEEAGESPADRESAMGNESLYLWGNDIWPPPGASGNFADDVIGNYEDDYDYTAPVGKFLVSPTGLYDLSGNVWEWVSDDYQEAAELAVARGGSWRTHDEAHLTLRHRDLQPTGAPLPSHGFRIVLAKLPESDTIEAVDLESDPELKRSLEI